MGSYYGLFIVASKYSGFLSYDICLLQRYSRSKINWSNWLSQTAFLVSPSRICAQCAMPLLCCYWCCPTLGCCASCVVDKRKIYVVGYSTILRRSVIIYSSMNSVVVLHLSYVVYPYGWVGKQEKRDTPSKRRRDLI